MVLATDFRENYCNNNYVEGEENLLEFSDETVSDLGYEVVTGATISDTVFDLLLQEFEYLRLINCNISNKSGERFVVKLGDDQYFRNCHFTGYKIKATRPEQVQSCTLQ